MSFERNVHTDCWATKRAVSVFLSPHRVGTVRFQGPAEILVRLNFAFSWFTSDALTGIPVHVLSHLTVGVIWIAGRLALTKVFDSSKHVLCNGFLVLDNLLNDDRFWEAFVDSLRLNGLSRSSKEPLLSITEGMGKNIAGSICNLRVILPVVVSLLLLTWTEISMSFLVHLGRFLLFLKTASHRIENILGWNTYSCCHTKRMSFRLAWPFLVATLV